MKEKKINVLYAVDLEDNTKTSLLALPSGVRCPRELAESVTTDFFSDEFNVKEMVNAICEDRQIDLCGYTIFFDEVTLYEL